MKSPAVDTNEPKPAWRGPPAQEPTVSGHVPGRSLPASPHLPCAPPQLLAGGPWCVGAIALAIASVSASSSAHAEAAPCGVVVRQAPAELRAELDLRIGHDRGCADNWEIWIEPAGAGLRV